MMQIRFTALLILLLPFTGHGQGIHFTYIGYTSFETMPSPYSTFFGIGYEQNLNSRISVSLDYNVGYSFGENTSFTIYYPEEGAEHLSLTYLLEMPWTEFSYNSKYYFSDNDDVAWYIGSGIAYRKVDFDLQVFDVAFDPSYASLGSELLKGPNVDSHVLVPISFKIGRRGSMDGWFGDINFGVSYIPGSGSKGSGNDAIDQILGKYYRSLTFNFGLLFGFGWAE